VREDVFVHSKALYCLDLRLGVKDLFMHKKHSLRALNIKITVLNGTNLNEKLTLLFPFSKVPRNRFKTVIKTKELKKWRYYGHSTK
jgi:hypothetical protein